MLTCAKMLDLPKQYSFFLKLSISLAIAAVLLLVLYVIGAIAFAMWLFKLFLHCLFLVPPPETT